MADFEYATDPASDDAIWRGQRKGLAAAIGSHPKYLPAVRRYTENYLNWRRGLGVMNKILSNIGREHLLEHLLYFHFRRVERQGEAGATFERLAALSAARDHIGVRAARSALGLAQTAGLITAGRGATDRRLRAFEPTEPLLRMTREAYALPFSILDDLVPSLGICKRLFDDSAFLPLILARLGDVYFKSEFTPRPPTDPFQNVLRLEGGRVIVGTAIQRHWSGLDLPTSQEIAWNYYVSPSQIRVVLKTAEGSGLIRTASRGRLIDAEPLAKAYADGTCDYLALYAQHAFNLDRAAFAVGKNGG